MFNSKSFSKIAFSVKSFLFDSTESTDDNEPSPVFADSLFHTAPIIPWNISTSRKKDEEEAILLAFLL